MNNAKSYEGFTLTELLITVAIVGILAAIAVPGYQSQMQKSRRAEAQTGLLQAAQALERCYSMFNVFNSTSCTVVSTGPTVSFASPGGYYTITTVSGGTETLAAGSYTLYAIPVSGGPQASDSCGTLSLTNTGAKSAARSSGCW